MASYDVQINADNIYAGELFNARSGLYLCGTMSRSTITRRVNSTTVSDMKAGNAPLERHYGITVWMGGRIH